MRRLVQIGVGLTATVLFGWLALRSADASQVWAGIRGADRLDLAISVVLVVLAFLVRGLRWRSMFADGVSVDLAVATTQVGLMLNAVLPARAGEIGRAVALRRLCRVPLMQSITATLVERVLDVAALAVLLLAVAPTLPMTTLTRSLLVVSVAVVVGAVVMVLVAVRSPARARDGVARLIVRASRTKSVEPDEVRTSVSRGLHAIRGVRAGSRASAYSMASWMLLAAANGFCLHAVGIDVPWSAAVLVLVATNFAAALPSTAGAIGPFEAAVAATLASHQILPTERATAAILIHAVNLVPALVLGLMAFGRLGLHLRDVRAGADDGGAA